jgi:hypothetical protein
MVKYDSRHRRPSALLENRFDQSVGMLKQK